MPPRQSRPPSTDTLLPPILNLLQPPTPNPYSAHQKALTTTARIAQSAPNVAVEILFATARELLKLGEAGSGVELGCRMISIMGDAELKVEDKSRGETSSAITSQSRRLQES